VKVGDETCSGLASVVQQALTHPSFRMNYGTNADHARNSLTNCGKRQLEYGDKRIHFIHTRKRGQLLLLLLDYIAHYKFAYVYTSIMS